MSRVLITGTSKGIGYDAALHLARAGHEVIATMRRPAASDLGAIARREGLHLSVHALDVNDTASVKSVFAGVGDVDVLINNAGILSYNAVEDEELGRFEEVMNTNFFGVVRCCKAVVPSMRARRCGTIINVSSVAGKIATGASGAYASSKHALDGLSHSLAQEMYPFGVKVYVVAPGIIHTPMATTELPRPNPDFAYPSGRRMMALFGFASQGDAPPSLVSEKFRELIERGSDRFHHPIGPDALIFLGYRLNTGDQRFNESWGHPDDAVFVERVRSDVMMDLGPFLEPPLKEA
ncbi:MAG: SDR family oxidoreductase [Pseudomonadales bacterium]|nr:SDR family oxidoreductase [Pseudomonadales bacterium]